jgi:uncharacterized repeat protein (TIGR01451 family)
LPVPVPLQSLALVRSYPSLQPLGPRGAAVTVDYSSDGTTWGSQFTIDSSLDTPTSFPVPAGMSHVRFRVASLAPGASFEMFVKGIVPEGTSLDATLQNCASFSGDGMTAITDKCATITVDPPSVQITPVKQAVYPAGKTAFQPGDTFEWIFGFHPQGALPITTATVSDLLPPEFEFLGVTCLSGGGLGSGAGGSVTAGACPGDPLPAYTTELKYDATGTFLGTLITFKDFTLPGTDSNSRGYGFHMNVRVRPGTSIKSYTNEVKVTTNDATVTCGRWYDSYSTTDTTDIDADGSTSETVCVYPSKVLVVEAAFVDMTKWDIGTKPNVFESTGTATGTAADGMTTCPDWNGYTRFPCTAVTDPGSAFAYRFRMQNSGNVEMTNYVAYDILPVIGDTGVGQLLSVDQRGTEWSPILTGPVTLNGGMSSSNSSGYVVEYNYTSNPCRPELNMDETTPDQPWQATCDNTWYSKDQVTDFSKVKSFRIKMFQPDTSTTPVTYPNWKPGDTYVFDVPMKAPLSAPTSTLDPLDLSVAWNSAAQRVYRTMAGAQPSWEQPYEPRQVGIIVPFTVPPAVSVGDYVWLDKDANGLQSAGDTPIGNVTVQLFDVNPDGSKGAWQATAITNADGYYSFNNLKPDTDYIIEFTKPTGMSFTTQNAGGDSSNSRDGDLTDSDADPTTGQVKFNSGPAGNNELGGPTTANAITDNPGIDAGFVTPQMNLQLQKSGGTWTGLLVPGTEVSWTLTPNNAGSSAAIAGWSVTDLVPTGMSIVSMSGAGYTCDITTIPTDPTCKAADGLAAGATGAPITVVTKVNAGWTGSTFRNVAYVDKSPNDVPETNPLVKPARDNDITNPVTPTDNDAQTPINVVSVGDFVWWDTNRDGLQTSGEAPVANLKVTLYAADGTTVLASTTTDANGYYAFTGLKPSTAYVIGFDKSSQPGASYTTPNAGGVTSNSATADLTDSDPVPADATTNVATVSFTSQATGSNLAAATKADNPGIDAGLVKFNLVLEKALTTAGPFYPGKSVSFTVTPKNEGPSGALAGWSVTDILPVGLTATGISVPSVNGVPVGSCALATLTCTFPTALAAGATGPVVTVTATIDASFTGTAINVAYVAPAPTDVPETNPLVKPSRGQDITNPVTPTDNDAMAPLSVPKVSIGDYVWWDTNRDGLQTAGEAVVPDGFVVKLYDAQGVYLRETTTTGGYYAFKDLTPATAYIVEFVKSSTADTTDASFTTANAGGVTSNSPTADVADSDADPTTGRVTVTTPNSGSNITDPTKADNPGIDAGLVKVNLQLTKSGGTWVGPLVPGTEVSWTIIPNNAGPSDAVAGWSVTDRIPTGMTVVSMAGAGYTCDLDTTPTDPVCTSPTAGLAVGASGAPITIVTKVNAGWTGSGFTNVAYVSPSAKEVPETNPLVVPARDTDVTITPTPTDNDSSVSIRVVSVGDYVWYDRNRDGQQGDASVEPVVEDGMVVNLLNADGTPVKTAAGMPVSTTTVGGYYAFTGLTPSTAYIVEFVKPAGTVFTTALSGATATDSNAHVTSGRAPVTTEASGNNLGTPKMADTPTIDAGLVELVSIGDYVWWDTNRDGLQSEGELPVAGVKVNLLNPDGSAAVLPGGAPVTTTTNASGFYSFTNLLAGVTYQVEFVKPADTIFTTQNAGGITSNDPTEDGTDSDADEHTGRVTVTAPITGANSKTAPDNPSIDAGLIELVSVGNYVWLDTNRDGLQDEGETPIAGVPVRLLDSEGNLAVLPGGAPVETVTNTDGYYWFTNLIGGVTYIIEFGMPDGEDMVFTTHNAGGDTSNSTETDTTDSDADPITGQVTFTAPTTGLNKPGPGSVDNPAVDNPTIDAGLIELVSVGDYVWLDVDRDGRQGDPAVEKPIKDVIVNLYDADGALWDTTSTNSDGFYSFTDLLAGASYTIEFIAPDGSSFTTPLAGTDKGIDSDAPADGIVDITAPATGKNSAETPDDPTFDAGIVSYNLTLVKKLTTTGPIHPGSTVTFTLTPHNDGPTAALAGWTVTDLLPAGLTATSMTGTGYTCTSNVCTATGMLNPNADGPVVTVTATVDPGFTGTIRNIAYITPSDKDVPETNPLGPVPTRDTDTKTTPTDNDTEAPVTITPVPLPKTGSDTTTTMIWLALLLLATGTAARIIATTRRHANGRAQR